jgi:tetratricopeptide (TPR) repeat protein
MHDSSDSVEFWESCHEQFVDLALSSDHSKQAVLERKALLDSLSQRFPGSSRVARLLLLNLEADGMLKSAFSGYSELGKIDVFGRKRILSLHRKAGNAEALEEALCAYLQVFQSDDEAWDELARLYAGRMAWKEALFCSEEVLLARPGNVKALCSHGSLLLSSGDPVLARKYFCRAAELDVESEVALRGILACLAENRSGCDDLVAWVEEKLKKFE